MKKWFVATALMLLTSLGVATSGMAAEKGQGLETATPFLKSKFSICTRDYKAAIDVDAVFFADKGDMARSGIDDPAHIKAQFGPEARKIVRDAWYNAVHPYTKKGLSGNEGHISQEALSGIQKGMESLNKTSNVRMNAHTSVSVGTCHMA